MRAAWTLTGFSSVYTCRLSGFSSRSIDFGGGAGAIMLSSSCRCRSVGRCGMGGPGLKLKPSANAGSAASVNANRGPARAGIRHRLEGACELAHFLQNSRGGHRWVLMLEFLRRRGTHQPEELEVSRSATRTAGTIHHMHILKDGAD